MNADTLALACASSPAHKQGLLHRDVKPANIMLTDTSEDVEQRILLADFGIARSAEDVSGLTATNMTVGTVAYSAPEQLMGEQLDGRADQYALAATAYHLLTGAQPFPHSNPAVVISHHLNADPPKLPDTRPDLAGLGPVLAPPWPRTRPAGLNDAATSPGRSPSRPTAINRSPPPRPRPHPYRRRRWQPVSRKSPLRSRIHRHTPIARNLIFAG
jgi:serine/threonine protein kinase